MVGASGWNMEDFPEPDDSKTVTFLADWLPCLSTRRSGGLRFSERLIANALTETDYSPSSRLDGSNGGPRRDTH